jgi:uroporphyrinogen-III synthase
MHDKVASALSRLRTIARGPKACRALRDVGLLPTVSADNPTTDGIIDALRDESLAGRTVGVQLYGQEPNARLTKYLERAGARVRTVAPYIYVRAIDDDRAFDLIDRLAKGLVDSIAFTSSRQIERLFEVAESREASTLLRTGLTRTRIAAVGPVAATSLRKRGFRIDIVPERSFFLKSLVQEVIAALR